MAYFQVTASELKEKAQELRSLNTRFSEESEKLSGYHNALSGMWEGETKESFSKEFLRDRSRMDSFSSAINLYIEALLSMASKYEEAENRNLALAGARSV